MSHEIVWTAAARTFVAKEGGRSGAVGTGYGNVLMTRALPANLTHQLENLQAYRELSPVPGVKSVPKLAPVEVFHFAGRYAGEPLHVLGRRARSDSASGRSNNIVHLVAFTASDFETHAPGDLQGPAMTAQSTPWEVTWAYDAAPTFRDAVDAPQLTRLPTLDCQKCQRWQDLTGDAGWAGVLADAVLAGKSVALIVPRSRDWTEELLQLFFEAEQLIAPDQRWRVGFSTYWTGAMPSGFRCGWRAVYDGTAEAAASRQHPQTICLDLERLISKEAPEGSLVTLARTGGPPPWRELSAPPGDDHDRGDEHDDEGDQIRLAKESNSDGESIESPKPLSKKRKVGRTESDETGSALSRWGKHAAIITAVAALAGVLLLFVRPDLLARWMSKPPKEPVASAPARDPVPSTSVSAAEAGPTLNSGPQLEPTSRPLEAPPNGATGKGSAQAPPAEGHVRTPPTEEAVAKLDVVRSEPAVNVPPSIPKARRSVFEDLRNKGFRLPVEPKATINGSDRIELTSFPANDPGGFELSLIGAGQWQMPATTLVMQRETGQFQWSVNKQVGIRPAPVGIFFLESDGNRRVKLLFTWKTTSALPFCWLGLTHLEEDGHKEQAVVALRSISRIQENQARLEKIAPTISISNQKSKKEAPPEAVEPFLSEAVLTLPAFNAVTPKFKDLIQVQVELPASLTEFDTEPNLPWILSVKEPIRKTLKNDIAHFSLEAQLVWDDQRPKILFRRFWILEKVNESTGEITPGTSELVDKTARDFGEHADEIVARVKASKKRAENRAIEIEQQLKSKVEGVDQNNQRQHLEVARKEIARHGAAIEAFSRNKNNVEATDTLLTKHKDVQVRFNILCVPPAEFSDWPSHPSGHSEINLLASPDGR